MFSATASMMPTYRFSRCSLFGKPTLWLAGLLMLGSSGCNLLNKDSDDQAEAKKRMEKLLTPPKTPDLIRDAVVPHGLTYMAVEGVAAVNSLPGTGGPVGPSAYRDELLEEMKKFDVAEPHKFLERPETTLVRVQAMIPPGARRGDTIDLRIVSPEKTEATDLHGGWLMDTRLRQRQMLAGAVRKGDVMAIGVGAITVRSDYDAGDATTNQLQGLVLGGGKVQQERKLGIVIRPEFQHVKVAAKLAAAINERFYYFNGTSRVGIAKAVEDDFIEIELPPRYRHNIHRMMSVVMMVCPDGETANTQHVLVDLGRRIHEPTTASEASLQLEALGESAIPTLLKAIESTNEEVRFYSAQALAYLDRAESVPILVEMVRKEAAFRHPALLALQGLDHQDALDGLVSLLDEASYETRYGAMCTIRRRGDGASVLPSTNTAAGFRVYQVASSASPFIAVSLFETPEIVCFGDCQNIRINDFLLGPNGIVVRRDENNPGVLRVSRFVPGQNDRRTEVPATVEGMITGICTVGGGYGEAIAMLRTAKDNTQLDCGFAIDPLPESMRTYYREPEKQSDDPAELPPQDIAPVSQPKESTSWWKRWRPGKS